MFLSYFSQLTYTVVHRKVKDFGSLWFEYFQIFPLEYFSCLILKFYLDSETFEVWIDEYSMSVSQMLTGG